MNKIRMTFFGNFIMTITLIISITLTFLLGVFNRFFIGGEEGELVFYALCAMVVLQIPTAIFLIHRVSKQRDLFVDGNEIYQKNVVLFKRHDIISISKVNVIKTEIKYKKDGEENVIYVTLSNKELNIVKELLMID